MALGECKYASQDTKVHGEYMMILSLLAFEI